MELNWTTFVLEIINFLVLVWLLKRFLYQPIKQVIDRRRDEVTRQLSEAEDKQQQADGLQQQYENRLADWERERQEARQQLQQEVETERQRLLQQLDEEMAAEREKAEVLAERQLQEQQRQNEIQALEQGAKFASLLLESIASPEVQERLFAHLLDDLEHLPPAQRDALQSVAQNGRPVKVISAWPLSEAQRETLQKALEGCVPHKLRYDYREDNKLIAGLRITVGPWVMHANLHDELKTFAAIAYER